MSKQYGQKHRSNSTIPHCVQFSWLADKINVPEKTLGLHSNWEVNAVLLSDDGSTRGENWEWIWCRIHPKRSKGLPSTLLLLTSPPPPHFQVAETAVPMGIHPAPFPCLHNSQSE